MEASLKEKVIEIVRNYECLYNSKHIEYKNKSYKLLLWERIGTTLDIDGNKAKEIWRSLRDGYVRYKKKTASSRQYHNYTWSTQMAFLDGTLELRPTSTNITAPQEAGSQSPESQISRQVSSPLPIFSPQPGPSYAVTPPSPGTPSIASSIQLSLSNSMHTSVSSLPPFSSQSVPSYVEIPPSPGAPTTASTIQLNVSNSRHANKQSLPPSAERSVKKRTISTNLSSEEWTDKVLEYLQNKNRKRHEYDDVDHLFASYAKTFKKLSRRTQAELKVNLAKLFAEAEITELDKDTQINESPQSQ